MNMASFGLELGVSRETVRKWKAAGMPVDSRDLAVAWIADNRPKYMEKLVESVVAGGAGAPPGGGDDLDGLDIHSTLRRFREIELRAWQDLFQALEKRKEAAAGTKRALEIDAEISRLDKRYKSAAADRLDMEKRVAEYDLETGRRVSMDRVKEMINDKWCGLVVQLKALPAMESRNCNPDDPETAERELNRWVNNLLRYERSNRSSDQSQPLGSEAPRTSDMSGLKPINTKCV
jgi:hypothetical protein